MKTARRIRPKPKTAETADRWIRVEINPGLFPSERVVRIASAEGDIALFVSTRQLDEEARLLRVLLLDQDDEYALVQLPSQGGSRVAKVTRSEVRSLAG
jgi:hypothetical protein